MLLNTQAQVICFSLHGGGKTGFVLPDSETWEWMACCELKRTAAEHAGAEGVTRFPYGVRCIGTRESGARDRMACYERRGAVADRAGGERSYGLRSARGRALEKSARAESMLRTEARRSGVRGMEFWFAICRRTISGEERATGWCAAN